MASQAGSSTCPSRVIDELSFGITYGSVDCDLVKFEKISNMKITNRDDLITIYTQF